MTAKPARHAPITPEQLHKAHRWIHLDEVVTLPGNPNKGDEASLAASIDEFGWLDGIVIRNGVVIAGNHRLERARARGEAGLPGYDLTGIDAAWDDVTALAAALTLNRSARAGADDPELLAAALASVGTVTESTALPDPATTVDDVQAAPVGQSTSEAQAGFVGSATRNLVLSYTTADYADLAAKAGDLAPDLPFAVLVAQLLGVDL